MLRQSVKRPHPSVADRLFWIIYSRYVNGWRDLLHSLHPDTVVRWHRQGFRCYWRCKNRGPNPGRPPINSDLRADLSRANLFKAKLASANLSGANLLAATLLEAHLGGANLSRADLSGAILSGAFLGGANLSEAVLHKVDLSKAKLNNVDLSEAIELEQWQLDEACGSAKTKLPKGLTLKPCPALPVLGDFPPPPFPKTSNNRLTID